MGLGRIYTRITKHDDDGHALRGNIMREGSEPWGDRKIGDVFFVENDGLCDVYAVRLGANEIGVIEVYPHRIVQFPDYDDDIELFQSVAGVL